MRAALAVLALALTFGVAACGTTNRTVVVPASSGSTVVVPPSDSQTTVVVPETQSK